MNKKQYSNILKKYVDKNFNTQKEAAVFFKCSPTTMTLTLTGDRTPMQTMLDATGHEYRKTVTEQIVRAK